MEEFSDNDSQNFMKENNKDLPNFIMINTNARSLCPKINLLVDCFKEIGATFPALKKTVTQLFNKHLAKRQILRIKIDIKHPRGATPPPPPHAGISLDTVLVVFLDPCL